MIVIDVEKCIGCGTCVKVCHNRCMALVNGIATFDDALCDRCTQCAGICPRQAISWDGRPPVAYEQSRLPSAEQLDELFKERRSMRFFKEQPIDRPLLEEIVGYGIYAPTNNHDLRAVVVDDVEVIEELERIAVRREWRGQGVGHRLVDYMIKESVKRGYSTFKMHAQAHLVDYYATHGFVRHGDLFDEAGIDHYLMIRHDDVSSQDI